MKIVFLHSMLRDYRTELFNRLSDEFGVEFIFTGARYYRKFRNEFKKARFKYKINKEWWNPFFNEDFNPLLFIQLLKYDVIIASIAYRYPTIIATLAKLFFGKKLIVWDETWSLPDNLRYNLFGKHILKLVASNADIILVSGTRSREFYKSLGVNNQRIMVAPNAALSYEKFKINKIKMEKIKKALGIRRKQFKVLYFGRIVKYKGLDILLNAFKKFEEICNNSMLIICGDGPYRKEMEEYAKKLGIRNVKFLGFVDDEEKPYYFNLCDVFTLPSRFMPKDNVCCEAWGLTINEVMSVGKPVITTTAVGAAWDLVKNGKNGYVVEQNNVEDLKEAMLKVLEKNHKKMGKESKRIIKRWNHDKMFLSFKKAILKVIENTS